MDGMTTLDTVAEVFGFDANSKGDVLWTTLGKVTSVSGSTFGVMLGGSDVATECEAYCLARVGDVVLVVVSKGRPRAVARKGGEYLSDMTYTARSYKLIPENTDLNTLTELGTWYRYNSTSVATLSNCPVEYAFKMFVERTIGTEYLVQTIRTYYGNAPEWRRYTSNGGTSWGDWYRTAPPTTDSATANRFLATPNGAAGQPSYRSIAAADLPTIPATKGGTGETSLNDSANAIINALAAATGNITDDDTYIITENINATEDKYYRRPVGKLWSWVKGKVSSETTVANVITQTSTQSTDYPITAVSYKEWGNVAQVAITVTPAAATSTNTNMSIGTLVSAKCPAIRANAGSAYMMGSISSAGEVSARPRTSLTGGTAYTISSTYII